MKISEFQKRIDDIYGDHDRRRGLEGTFAWFVEEIGELSRALRRQGARERQKEFADCLAWLSTLATIAGVDLEAAATHKYKDGCPRCQGTPCRCPEPTPTA